MLHRVVIGVLSVTLCVATVHADCLMLTAKYVMSSPDIDLVFAGRVVRQVWVGAGVSRVTFDVDRVWKGAVPTRLDLYVSDFHVESPRFTTGDEYVALAGPLKDAALRKAAGLPITDAPTEYMALDCSGSQEPHLAEHLGPAHQPKG